LLRFQTPNIIPIYFFSFKTITNIHSSRFLSRKTNHCLLTKEGCENKYSQDLNRKLFSEKKSKKSEVAFLNRRKRRWWKIPTRWAMESSNVWWLVEGKGKASFHLFSLSRQEIFLKLSFFPLILKFYFIMVIGHYLHISFYFFDL
jgi:hypothetical protein